MRRSAVLGMLVLAGCVRSNFNLATQQQEYTMTSTDKEVAMGRKLVRRVLKELPLVADEALQQKVRTIGARLAAVCDRQELIYSFAVVQDPEVNAFSLPGGYVFINEGLTKKVTNDNELAAVIAHEIAHIAARHAVKRYESALGLQLVQLATVATRQGEAAQGITVAAQAAQLAYARDDELEADKLAVKYLKAAEFDPTAILSFLNTLHTLDQEKSHYLPRGVVRPQYALTHPYVPERLRAVKEALYGVADYMDYLNTPD
ncbi:MAG: M48 family metalloprotease [Candidatus Omnitrophica bacterium]|nr:M48 family metalloprotease [Candidatus Omnitrophota bacterium]